MRLLKLSATILLLILSILALSLLALRLFINPNQIKPSLANTVKTHTGYNLAIEGDLTWSFYPHLGIKAKQISLQAPEQPQPFLVLNDVRFATSLTQLWKHKENLNGNVYISQAQLADVKCQHLKATLNWQKNVLHIADITGEFYQGTLAGKVEGGDFATIRHWSWNFNLKNFQVKNLVADLYPKTGLQITGLGNLHFRGATAGRTRADVLNNVNGVLDFDVTNGVLHGVDINYLLQSVDAFLHKDASSIENNGATIFNALTANVQINKGIASTNDLLLSSAFFSTQGNGHIDLINQAIDLSLLIKPRELRITYDIPLKVSGSLSKPKINLDSTDILNTLAKQAISSYANHHN